MNEENVSESNFQVSDETKHIETELFIEALYQLCGHDMRHYSRSSLRRLVEALALKEHTHISALIPMLAHDSKFKRRVLNELTVSYSTLFRDPLFFSRLKENVFPRLRTFPRLSIWVPGCASGEEVYSLAIALHEEDLLNRCQIYATDISMNALKQAQSGLVQQPINSKTVDRYNDSGGNASLSDYFFSDQYSAGHSRFDPELLEKISFKRHDLIQEANFISPQLILCRNVFIYFDSELQNNVLNKLADALVDGGYLAVGLEENIRLSDEFSKFDVVSQEAKIFQKKY